MPRLILVLPALVVLLSAMPLADAPEIRKLKNLKFTGIQVPGARLTEASGINNLSEIVGTWEDAITRRVSGFRLRGGVYTSIDIPGAVLTTASDINDAGDIVGTYHQSVSAGQLFGDSHGYLLTADGQRTTITFPGQRVTWAVGINNRRQIVGGYSEWAGDQLLGVHSFMLDENGVFTPIDFPVPTPRAHIFVTYASAINDAGDIVGGYDEDDIYQSRRGFVLSNGVYSNFNVPGSDLTDVFGLNGAGEIVGEYLDGGQLHGFLFNPRRGFYRVVDTGGWQLPFDINNSDQIVGSGAAADGSLRSFVAAQPPGWSGESALRDAAPLRATGH